MKTLLEKLTSRKLWVSVGATTLAVLLQQAQVPQELITIIVIPAISYVLGESAVDAFRAANQSEQ